MQGAATGLACLECRAVFNQGAQALGFFSLFFLGKEKGLQKNVHAGWQKGLTLADW